MKKLLLIFSVFCCQQLLAQSAPRFSMVKDIYPGSQGSGALSPVHCNGRMFFTALSPGSLNWEVWVTDGTEAGTKLTRDVNPTGSYPASGLTVLNEKVIFVQYTPETGRELYITDGTFDGTKQIMDINPGPANSDPSGLTVYNGRVYFAATSPKGRELWVTDGTAGGTSIVNELWAGANTQGPERLGVALGKLFFTCQSVGERHLYITDGTTAGTVKFKDFAQTGSVGPHGFKELNGKMYFTASDASNGYELWISDGTESGTQLLKDINPGTARGSYLSEGAVICNGRIYFRGDDGTGGRLWATDGTAGGTVKVDPDVEPRGALYVYNNRIYFCSLFNKLWSTDGTAAGTTELKSEIQIGSNFSATPKGSFYQLYGTLYFIAESTHPLRSQYGMQLWQSDGTDAGTTMIMPPPPALGGYEDDGAILGNIGSDLLLRTSYSGATDGNELWKLSLFPAGVNDNAVSSSHYIYPNPTTGTIHIQLPLAKDASVKIYSLTGQLMLQQSLDAQLSTISVNALAPGQYIAHITTDGKTTVEKLVKQ